MYEYQNVWRENMKGRDHLQDLRINGRITCLKEILWAAGNWINLA
jgi:hypothetical protein